MARKSIFDLLSEHYDLEKEVVRLDKLFEREKTLIAKDGFIEESFSLKRYVDLYCFDDWKNRGHCLDLADFLDCVDYDEHYDNAIGEDIESFLLFIEIIFNCWKMAEIHMNKSVTTRYYSNFYHLYDIMVENLSRYNFKAIYDANKEQILVVEDRPEITAVAEIVEPELSLALLRYNHCSMRGDIAQKKSILLALGAELEPKRKILAGTNSQLEDGIFFMLNNLNLRHNNCSKEDKNYKAFVAEMENKDLEEWYDELYQMILLAFLELDQLERNSKIKDLKTNINGGTH